MDARLHVQQRTEKTPNWNGHPKPVDDKGQRRTTTKVNDVQRHGNDEQQNGQRTMLFGRRMYAWELQADYDESGSNSSNAGGRFRSVKGAHDGAGRLVGQPVRQWLPVGGATTRVRCTHVEVVPDDRRSPASRGYLRHIESLSTNGEQDVVGSSWRVWRQMSGGR